MGDVADLFTLAECLRVPVQTSTARSKASHLFSVAQPMSGFGNDQLGVFGLFALIIIQHVPVIYQNISSKINVQFLSIANNRLIRYKFTRENLKR